MKDSAKPSPPITYFCSWRYSFLQNGCSTGAPIGPQSSILRRGIDVVVGTPGRVIDLLNRGDLRLNEVSCIGWIDNM